MRCSHPDGTTVHLALLHQRPPGRGPRRRPSPSSSDYGEPVRQHARRRPARHRAVARRPPRRAARRRPRRRAPGCGTSSTRAAWRSSPSTASPTRGFQRRGGQARASTSRTGPSRRASTTPLDLARLLAALLPDDVVRGHASRPCRSPGAHPWPATARRAPHAARSTTLAERLDALDERDRAQPIRVAPRARARLHHRDHRRGRRAARRGVAPRPDRRLPRHCATSPSASRTRPPRSPRLDAAGVAVVKAQLSARAARRHPPDAEVRAALARFAEPRFLHQTRARATASACAARDDLAEALDGGALPDDRRRGASHFHVPAARRPRTAAAPHRDDLRAALAALVGGDRSRSPDHLEVETYTWSVAPATAPPPTTTQLAAGHRRRAGLAARPPGRPRAEGAAVTGPGRHRAHPAPRRSTSSASPPSCCSTCRACAASADAGSQAPLDTVLPAVTCSVQSTFLTGTAARRARHRRQRLVLPRPRRGPPLAPAQRARRRARRCGTPPAARHPGYTVANICWWYAMGADTDWTVTPRPDLLRRRPQGARLLHPPARPARRAHRQARHLPALPLLGPRRRPRLLAVDHRRHPALLATRSPT